LDVEPYELRQIEPRVAHAKARKYACPLRSRSFLHATVNLARGKVGAFLSAGIGQNTWGRALAGALGEAPTEIWVERGTIPAIVSNHLDETYPGVPIRDISAVLGEIRMIKSPFEIEVMKEAGQIAAAMMAAAHASLNEGAQEYESALAVIDAGTRKAASFLTAKGWERFVSPMIHNLQILQSGKDTSMVHRRASVKACERFDPVYFCFCNMAQFKQYKLGFDRMFHVGAMHDDAAEQRAHGMGLSALHVNGVEPPGSQNLGDPARVRLVSFVAHRRQCGIHLPGFHTNHIKTSRLQPKEKKLAHRTSLETNAQARSFEASQALRDIFNITSD